MAAFIYGLATNVNGKCEAANSTYCQVFRLTLAFDLLLGYVLQPPLSRRWRLTGQTSSIGWIGEHWVANASPQAPCRPLLDGENKHTAATTTTTTLFVQAFNEWGCRKLYSRVFLNGMLEVSICAISLLINIITPFTILHSLFGHFPRAVRGYQTLFIQSMVSP